MTTTAPPAAGPPPAPWRADLLSDLSTMHESYFSLATVSVSSPPTPQVRTVTYRGLFAGLELNRLNPAEPNPTVYETDFLTATTDDRRPKVSEIFAGGPTPSADVATSGGGGPVEMMCFVPGRMTQWRISGRAYLLGPDADGGSAKPVRDVLLSRMRRIWGGSDDDAARWSFSREVTAHFGNFSPSSRGWFRQPTPGLPRDGPVEDPRLGMGQEVNDLEDEAARKYFRLLVVVPDRVDKSNLADSRRWFYDLVDGGEGSSNTWKTVEVWP